MKKKGRFLAGFLAVCMLMEQTVFAEETVTDEQLYTESISEEAAVSEEQGETTSQSDLEADTENGQNIAQEQKRGSEDQEKTEQTEPGIQEESEHKEDSLEVQPEAGLSESSDQEESREIVSRKQNEIEEVSLEVNNEPVTISTEIDEAGETVRYCFRPEESGGYYIDLMDQGQFSVYEETSYGGYNYIGNDTSTDDKYGSIVFDAAAGTTYYIDIKYDDAESVGTIKWKLGRPQQVKTGSYEAVINEPGGKAHYELLCEDVDMVYIDIDRWSSGSYSRPYYDLWYENGHSSFHSSGYYGKSRIQNGRCFVSIYYYDLTSTGTVEWQADNVYTQNVSENESVHTVVSSDDEHLVYIFTPQEDGKYGITYYNVSVYNEFWNSVGNRRVDLQAGATYYIMLHASAGDDFSWSIKRSNEIVIEAGETIRTEAEDVDYYKFIPEESGMYSISSNSVNIYDSDWNEIEGYKVELLEGDTYYITVSGGDSAVDWNISKMKETEITAGQSYLVAPEKSEYFKFVPDKSGEYAITTSGWMSLYDSEWNDMWGYELTEGKTYYLMSDSTDETFYFSIDLSEETGSAEPKRIEIQTGKEYITMAADAGNWIGYYDAVRYVFVPEETGRYQFRPDDQVYLAIMHGDDVSMQYCPEYSLYLNAGEEYEIMIGNFPSLMTSGWTELHWCIEKSSVTEVEAETEYSTSEENAQDYRFIPDTSGNYMLDVKGEGDYAVYDSDWNLNREGSEGADIYDYKDKGEFGGVFRLEAGKTYYINIYPYSGNLSWRISRTEQTDEYLYRTLTDGTVQILKYLGNANSIEIPEYIDGKEVTSIGPGAFYENVDLREIIIPDSVRSIKAEAFFGCGGLESIELGSELQEIGKSAFAWAGLTAIDLPDSLTILGEEAFSGCPLNSVDIGMGLKAIEDGTFSSCALQAIDIPDSVESIGEGAFGECSSLKEVSLGSNVKYIGGSAFYTCDLSEIVLNDGLLEIGEDAFFGNRNLLEIEIPDSVEAVGRSAFEYTAWYESQEDGILYAGKVLYEYKGIMPEGTTVTVADGTKGIAGAAFEYQYGLEEIVLPDTLTNIGEYAFYGCGLLTEIHIPQSVDEIGRFSLGYLSVTSSAGRYSNILKVPNFTIYGVAGSAAQTYAEENGFVFVEVEPEYTPGDIDESGRVDIADLRMVLRAVCGKTELTSQQQLAADVETDGTVNIADLRKILRFVCGKLEEL